MLGCGGQERRGQERGRSTFHQNTATAHCPLPPSQITALEFYLAWRHRAELLNTDWNCLFNILLRNMETVNLEVMLLDIIPEMSE